MNLDGAPRLVSGVADVFQKTIGAFRLAGNAEGASVQDDLVREDNPLVPRDDAHKVLLDVLGIVVGGQLQPARDAVDVSVHDDAFGLVEPGAENDIRRLAGDAGQREELIHVVGNLAAEIVDYRLCCSDDGLRLVPEEAGGLDVGLKLFGSEGGEILNSRIFLEQAGGDHVHAGVGALRREDGSHEEFPCTAVVESAGRCRISCVEALQDIGNAIG